MKIDVKEIRKISVKEDEVLLVRTAECVSMDQYECIKTMFSDCGLKKVIVIYTDAITEVVAIKEEKIK